MHSNTTHCHCTGNFTNKFLFNMDHFGSVIVLSSSGVKNDFVNSVAGKAMPLTCGAVIASVQALICTPSQ